MSRDAMGRRKEDTDNHECTKCDKFRETAEGLMKEQNETNATTGERLVAIEGHIKNILEAERHHTANCPARGIEKSLAKDLEAVIVTTNGLSSQLAGTSSSLSTLKTFILPLITVGNLVGQAIGFGLVVMLIVIFGYIANGNISDNRVIIEKHIESRAGHAETTELMFKMTKLEEDIGKVLTMLEQRGN